MVLVTVTADHRPTLGSVGGATVALGLLAAVLATVDMSAAVPAVIAISFFVFAGVSGSRKAMTLGVMAIILSLIIGGIVGASPSTLLAAGVLAITAWDVLDHGFSLGNQVGRTASTRRNELVHGGSTLLVGTGLAAVLLVLLSLIPGGWPVAAVMFALLAGMFALLALERDG